MCEAVWYQTTASYVGCGTNLALLKAFEFKVLKTNDRIRERTVD